MPRSPLLEEFRLNRSGRKWELKVRPRSSFNFMIDRTQEIFGYFVEFAGDQHGSRFIQNRIENCSTEDRQRIFDEILPNAFQLMIDVFGNYVIQKMFEHGDEPQKEALAQKMVNLVKRLSVQMYGCRVSRSKEKGDLERSVRCRWCRKRSSMFCSLSASSSSRNSSRTSSTASSRPMPITSSR